jgi:RNA polymerase sigma factor (TIGR02999 family)
MITFQGMATQDAVSALMRRFRNGDRDAAGSLVELLYPQLKKLAKSRMRSEATPHTWQPTVLVNELYLELMKIRALRAADADQQEHEAFLNLASHLMRRLLIQHARPLAKRVPKQPIEGEFPQTGNESLLEVEDLLTRLAGIDPQLRTVVEMRVFEGLTVDEVAGHIGCSERTVARCWTFAKTWLAEEIAPTR